MKLGLYLLRFERFGLWLQSGHLDIINRIFIKELQKGLFHLKPFPLNDQRTSLLLMHNFLIALISKKTRGQKLHKLMCMYVNMLTCIVYINTCMSNYPKICMHACMYGMCLHGMYICIHAWCACIYTCSSIHSGQ